MFEKIIAFLIGVGIGSLIARFIIYPLVDKLIDKIK